MIALSLLYLAFVCIFTIDQWDLGFLPSMIGRLKSGQTIYEDFDYVRPFFSIIFWDYILFFIPSTSEYFILLCRFFVIVECVIICVIIQKLIFYNVRLNVTLFFVISFLHTFPIMLWHTIDGIFFGVISLYFYKRKLLLSSLIFLGFTALTKQSFFIFSLGIFFIVLKDLFKNFKYVKKDFFIFIIFLSLFAVSLYRYKIIDNFQLFFNQVFSSTSSSGFYQSSIAPYFFESKLKSILFICFLLFVYCCNIKRELVNKILLIIFLLIVIYPVYFNGKYVGIHSVFLLLVVLFFKYDRENKFIFFLLFLNWSASISWGYNIPVFLIFILVYRFIEQKNKFILMLWMISLGSFLGYRLIYTYQSENPLYSHYLITKGMPSISGLFISEREYSYLIESRKIKEEYEDVVFLPGSPILDIINENFITRASWEMDVEYPNWKNDFLKLKTNTVAIDNQQFEIFKEGFYKSSFTVEMTKQKKIIKKTKYFTIYK